MFTNPYWCLLCFFHLRIVWKIDVTAPQMYLCLNDSGMNSLTARGLEKLFFQLCCCCVSFLVLAGNRFWCYLVLRTTQLWHCVSYSFWREIVLGVIYVLRVQWSCAVVSVFWLLREIVLKMRTPFDFLWAVSTRKFLLGYFIMIR